MLYDSTVIPVQDYLVPTAITLQLGERTVIELLEDASLRFVRVDQHFAVLTPGAAGSVNGGFCSFAYPTKKGESAPTATSIEESVASACYAIAHATGRRTDPLLAKLLLARTLEADISSAAKAIGDRTISQLHSDASLRSATGVEMVENQVRIPGPKNSLLMYSGVLDEGDRSTQKLVRLFAANVEFWLAGICGAIDVQADGAAEALLSCPLEIVRASNSGHFTHLRQIAGLPDIGFGAFHSQLVREKLMAHRNTRAGHEFRRWFHSISPEADLSSVVKEYGSLLRAADPGTGLPSRVLRFVIGIASGMLPGVGIGEVVGVADAFFIDPLLRRGTAKVFLEELGSWPSVAIVSDLKAE